MPEFASFSIPLGLLLLLFGFYLLFYIFYSLFNIYHLVRYGVSGFGLYLIITVFSGGTILLVVGSLFFLSHYDWTQSYTFDRTTNIEEVNIFQNYDEP